MSVRFNPFYDISAPPSEACEEVAVRRAGMIVSVPPGNRQNGGKDEPDSCWLRSTVRRRVSPGLRPETDELKMTVFDITWIYGRPERGMWHPSRAVEYPVPVFHLYGVDGDGRSIDAAVHGFLPYMYLRTETEAETVRRGVENFLSNRFGRGGRGVLYAWRRRYVLSVEEERCRILAGFHPPVRALRLELADQGYVRSVRDAVLDGNELGQLRCTPFECNIDFVRRFMIDTGVSGTGWISVPAGKWKCTRSAGFCTANVAAGVADLSPVQNQTNERLNGVRILSVDIECAGLPNTFPVAERDRIVTICCRLTEYGSDPASSVPVSMQLNGGHADASKGVFTFGRDRNGRRTLNDTIRNAIFDCSQGKERPVSAEDVDSVICDGRGELGGRRFLRPLAEMLRRRCGEGDGSRVLRMITDNIDRIDDRGEQMMLAFFEKLVTEYDPDVITGYNVGGFDLPYIVNRYRILHEGRGPVLGRRPMAEAAVVVHEFRSKQIGVEKRSTVVLDGRWVLDLLPFVRRTSRLPSYTLNYVANRFLDDRKEDVHHGRITGMFEGDDDDRERLMRYCDKDAQLPVRLCAKLNAIESTVPMCRVSHTLPRDLYSRGQQNIVLTKIMHFALHSPDGERYILPYVNKSGPQDGSVDRDRGKYSGGSVLSAVSGFYRNPVATLDFSSMYPTILIAHNVCITTYVLEEDRKKIGMDECAVSPDGPVFVRRHVRAGILPRMIEDILVRRADAKRSMVQARADGNFREEIFFNMFQNTLKVMANSVYGIFGSGHGLLSCVDLARAITSYGRAMLQTTERKVAELEPERAEVIYGDTDSVMVRLKNVGTVAESAEIGRRLASSISRQFEHPIRLEYEKVYMPFLLITKKRYLGLAHIPDANEDGGFASRMESRGIENVRRDSCRLLSTLMDRVCRCLMNSSDTSEVESLVAGTVSDLRMQRISLDQLVISKKYTKERYAAKQTHVELARRMKKRDPETAPSIGDRIQYVVLPGLRGTPLYRRVESPLHVLKNGLDYCATYYIEKQLRVPLERILEHVIGRERTGQLFSESGVTVVRRLPAARPGTITRFLVSCRRCLCCGVPLRDTGSIAQMTCPLCRGLPPHAGAVRDAVGSAGPTAEEYAATLRVCEKCRAGTGVSPVEECLTAECDVLYRREAQKSRLQKIKRVLLDASGNSAGGTCGSGTGLPTHGRVLMPHRNVQSCGDAGNLPAGASIGSAARTADDHSAPSKRKKCPGTGSGDIRRYLKFARKGSSG